MILKSEEEREVIKKYNFMAKEYHDYRTKLTPAGGFFNEMLEVPATLSLLGNVKGEKILDFGCGTGIYAKLLAKKGAIVKGFDISPEMIKIANQENPKLELKVGSAYNIPFKEKFDIVLASLVVHYLGDWNKMFSEVRRVLKPRGIFLFSTGNPVAEFSEKINVKNKRIRALGDYFKEGKKYAIWQSKLKVFSYHRTYETLINSILKNNFEIIGYKDAFPIKKAKKFFPEDYKVYSKIPFFTVWRLRLK